MIPSYLNHDNLTPKKLQTGQILGGSVGIVIRRLLCVYCAGSQ